eukprot:GGOE01001213.1.p1 GENE.GGOE01001213.1~~GGOE01001213.1.p1  ORF type:complete len:569 (+),score=95.37 GGOE01001213.1:157-1863(+)
MGFVVGKKDDHYVLGEWLSQCEGGMLESDEAIATWVQLHHPEVQVTVCRPRRTGVDSIASRLKDCDVIHILESEEWLTGHDYRKYRQMFQALLPVADRIVPSLATMQFIMSKVDYLRLLEAHGLPHAPTFVMERPAQPAALEKQVHGLAGWVDNLVPRPTHLITKPSHSGTRTHLQKWDVAQLCTPQGSLRFVQCLRRLLATMGKPFLLVQPFIDQLAAEEYRHYFVGRQFISCLRTEWLNRSQLLAQTIPLAEKVVLLLPPDSGLYRVDVFQAGSGWCINEVEMVDASLLPDDQPAGSDIVEALAQHLTTLRPTQGVNTACHPSLPLVDEGHAIPMSSEDWHRVRQALGEALRRICHPPPSLPTSRCLPAAPQLLTVGLCPEPPAPKMPRKRPRSPSRKTRKQTPLPAHTQLRGAWATTATGGGPTTAESPPHLSAATCASEQSRLCPVPSAAEPVLLQQSLEPHPGDAPTYFVGDRHAPLWVFRCLTGCRRVSVKAEADIVIRRDRREGGSSSVAWVDGQRGVGQCKGQLFLTQQRHIVSDWPLWLRRLRAGGAPGKALDGVPPPT